MSLPWSVTPALDAAAFYEVRRRTIFEHHKYDPQVGDTPMLIDYALLLKNSVWQQLAQWAESLTQELRAAEAELAQKPHLHNSLGIPASIARCWTQGIQRPAQDVRVMRFDFHYTTSGWRISECNCDTPGGYNEAVGFTSLMSAYYPQTELTGNPAALLAEQIAATIGTGSHVALVYPTAFAEDQQILLFLRQYLEKCGLITHFTSPTHLHWRQGQVICVQQGQPEQAIDYILRYFPAEWLPSIGRSARWQDIFTSTYPPMTNPTTALLPQSKRFPLVWEQLATPLPTWRALLPTTMELKRLPQAKWRDWVLKPMFGRFGNDIAVPGVASAKLWETVLKSARRRPHEWIAQEPFQPIPFTAPDGTQVYPCIGIYTVQGRAAGIYGRLSQTPIVDSTSRDIAILKIEDTAL